MAPDGLLVVTPHSIKIISYKVLRKNLICIYISFCDRMFDELFTTLTCYSVWKQTKANRIVSTFPSLRSEPSAGRYQTNINRVVPKERRTSELPPGPVLVYFQSFLSSRHTSPQPPGHNWSPFQLWIKINGTHINTHFQNPSDFLFTNSFPHLCIRTKLH